MSCFGRFSWDGVWGALAHLTLPYFLFWGVFPFLLFCVGMFRVTRVQKGPPHLTLPLCRFFWFLSWTIVEVRWPFSWHLGHLTSPSPSLLVCFVLSDWMIIILFFLFSRVVDNFPKNDLFLLEERTSSSLFWASGVASFDLFHKNPNFQEIRDLFHKNPSNFQEIHAVYRENARKSPQPKRS